jgi:AcrR family transcriptional regulator
VTGGTDLFLSALGIINKTVENKYNDCYNMKKGRKWGPFMYKDCRTEQSAQRQRDLEKGLLAAMKQQRFDDISICDLCDRMEVPRKSFYRYFSGKEGALYALLDHTLMEFEPFMMGTEPGSKRTMQRDLETFFSFWLGQRDLLDALARSNLSGMLIERAVAYSLTDDVLPSRFLPNDSKKIQRKITKFGVYGLMSMVLTWHSEDYAEDPKVMAKVATRILSQPLFPGADNSMR